MSAVRAKLPDFVADPRSIRASAVNDDSNSGTRHGSDCSAGSKALKLSLPIAWIICGLVQDTKAMPPSSGTPTQPSSGFDMMRDLGWVLLKKPEQAIDLVETLVRIRFGEAEVEAERPYVAEDLGDAWKVTGTRFGSDAIPFFPSRCIVVVRKASGEILDFTHEMRGPDGNALRAPPHDGSTGEDGETENEANPG
jgi:hypothetical protein